MAELSYALVTLCQAGSSSIAVSILLFSRSSALPLALLRRHHSEYGNPGNKAGPALSTAGQRSSSGESGSYGTAEAFFLLYKAIPMSALFLSPPTSTRLLTFVLLRDAYKRTRALDRTGTDLVDIVRRDLPME